MNEAIGLNRHALWNHLKQVITDDDLYQIARADYGQDIEKHLEELRQIYRTGVVPDPMRWHPKEVIELCRWSSSHEPYQRKVLLKSLFCVTILLESATQTNNSQYLNGENQDVIIAVHSAYQLGDIWLSEVKTFLEDVFARLPQESCYESGEPLFFPLGILILSCYLHEGEAGRQQWVDAVKTAYLRAMEPWDSLIDPGKSLLEASDFDHYHQWWKEYLDRVAEAWDIRRIYPHVNPDEA